MRYEYSELRRVASRSPAGGIAVGQSNPDDPSRSAVTFCGIGKGTLINSKANAWIHDPQSGGHQCRVLAVFVGDDDRVPSFAQEGMETLTGGESRTGRRRVRKQIKIKIIEKIHLLY